MDATTNFKRDGSTNENSSRWKPRDRVLISLFLACLVAMGTVAPGAKAAVEPTNGKKLIEIGWDFPRTRWLLQHLDERQDLPFDGMAFSPSRERLVLTNPKAWHASAMRLRDLPKIRWGRYTDNFILVWAHGTTEMDWTDDARWRTVLANARLLSKAVAASGAQGVMLDPEVYSETHPWAYEPERYPGLSFEDVEAIVRDRGAGFMNELASDSPDVEVLSLLSIGYVANAVRFDRTRLADSEYALLPAFIEGLLIPDRGTVIDGDEMGYFVDETTEFPERRSKFERSMEFASPFVSDVNVHELATPVFMDLTLGLGPFDRGYSATYEHSWFEHNVYHSLLAADEYAWVYGERVDWWRGWIPDGALEDLRAAVALFRAGEPLGFDMVGGGMQPPSRLVSSPAVRLDGEVDTSGEVSLSVVAEGAARIEFFDGSRLLGITTGDPLSLDISAACEGTDHMVARAFAPDGSHTTSNIVRFSSFTDTTDCLD